MATAPVFVSWTLHALDKAEQFGFARSDLEAAILSGHAERRRNPGRASWQVQRRHMAIVYEHPDGDDPLTARVVTVWRR